MWLYRVSLLGRRQAIVAGRHGAETANVAGRPMANSSIFIPRFDVLSNFISYPPNDRKCIRHERATIKYVLLLYLSHKNRRCQQLETGEYVVSGSENVSAIDFVRILEQSVISPQNFGE